MDESEKTAGKLALDHWRKTIADPTASDTAKDNAAKGLAAFERQQTAYKAGTIHRLTRAELTYEIDKVKSLLEH